jgi:arginyl-tRNA synthetase
VSKLLSRLRSLLDEHGLADLCSKIETRTRANPYTDVRLFFRPAAASAATANFLKELQASPEVASIRAKAGSVSVRLTDDFIQSAGIDLEQGVAPDSRDQAGEPRRLVGFLGANSSKPLHLGHLRNIVIGNALASAFVSAGFPTETYSLVGDIGRNVCEAMAGYELLYNGRSPEDTGGKPDHFVGRCYTAYLAQLPASLPATGQADPCAREYRPVADLADQLLGRWSSGDPETRRLWRWVCELVEAGHAETLNALGITVNRRWRESAHVDRALELVDRGLREGMFELLPSGAVVYSTGREEFKTLVLRRSDGFPTEHARVVAVFAQIFADCDQDLVHVDWNGTEWQPAQAVLTDLMRRLSLIPDRVVHRPTFHGMVLADGTALASSSGDPLLTDDLLDRLRAHEGIAALREIGRPAVGNEVIADQVLKAFFLGTPVSKDLAFSWARLVDREANPGWKIATAWCLASAADGPGTPGSPADPAYRLAVLQGEAFAQALDQTVTKFDPIYLHRFIAQLAENCQPSSSVTPTARAVRTLLRAGLSGLGIAT